MPPQIQIFSLQLFFRKKTNLKKMKIAEQIASRNENEKIYSVDKSVPLTESEMNELRSRQNAPSDIVKAKIDEYVKVDSKGMGLYRLLASEPDVDHYLCILAKACDWITDKKMAFWFAKQGLYNGVDCATCGKKLSFRELRQGHRYCSNKCAQNDKDLRGRMKATCVERYGVENPAMSNEIRDRMKATCIERYGVENPSLSPEICEKRRATLNERYGVNSYTQTDEYKEKARRTNLERYGVELAAMSEMSKEKAKATNLERYGVENPFMNEDVKKKIANTNLERYGVPHPMMSDEIKSRAYEHKQRTFYRKMLVRYAKYAKPLFSEDEYASMTLTSCELKWKCVKCGHVFRDFHNRENGGTFRGSSVFPLCPECFPKTAGSSLLEHEVFDFVKETFKGDVIEHDRTVLDGYELDIYIPEKHLAIEFDGMFWHSEQNGKEEGYHLAKTEKCLENGIRLIHIFENEWVECDYIVKDMIKSALGIYDEKIYARKCRAVEIDSRTANNFLDWNHLQGGCGSSVQYGLYHDDRLVAVMTFGKPRFNEKYDWELIRFVSDSGVQVVGGAGKMLHEFMKSHAGSILSYADRRYSNGGVYEKIGFSCIGKTSPNYWWVKSGQLLSRYQCQKHRLAGILKDKFDPELSEVENMTLSGWTRIFDCGNLVYVIER